MNSPRNSANGTADAQNGKGRVRLRPMAVDPLVEAFSVICPLLLNRLMGRLSMDASAGLAEDEGRAHVAALVAALVSSRVTSRCALFDAASGWGVRAERERAHVAWCR